MTFQTDLDRDIGSTFLGDVAGGNGGEFAEAGWSYRVSTSAVPSLVTVLDRRDLTDTRSEIRREFSLRTSDVPACKGEPCVWQDDDDDDDD